MAIIVANRPKTSSSTITMAANDWGFELAGREPFFQGERQWRQVLSPANLLDDLLACLNGTEMARRHFREIWAGTGLALLLTIGVVLALQATVLPALVRLLGGRRIQPSLHRIYGWVMRNQFPIVGAMCAAVGVFLVVTAVTRR